MKKKIHVLSLAIALTLLVVAFISGSSLRAATSPSNPALASLPASDIVVTIDTQRLLSETLPVMLADNPALLAKVNDKIARFNQDVGIDLRTFNSLAVGLRFKSPSADNFEAVVIANGHFNSTQVLEAAFTAAKKKRDFQKKDEQYEGKTIFVILPQQRQSTTSKEGRVEGNSVAVLTAEPPAKTRDATSSPRYEVEVRTGRNRQEMAVVALDANTLAFGDLKSVRAAVDASLGRDRVDDELVRMATQNSSALVGFSGKIPPSVTEKMAASGKSVESKYLASIRKFYGSFNTTGADAETFLAVQTEKPNEAQDISQALNSLKLLSGFSMMQPGRSDVKSIATLLKDVSITAQGNEVQIRLNIKQKDLAPFMRRF
ncbi:MAG TPA: hypothetical protein VEQ40_03675 [Pyrinomonadaceae bacterium]|nr:hypothetical protein [Pyrinomonadaceae bacterium]